MDIIIGGVIMVLTKAIKKRREAAERARKKAKAAKIAKVAATGVTLGAIGGVLFAPKSGKETRKDITDGISDTSQAISNKSKKIASKTNDSLKNTKDKIGESKEKIKDYFDKKKNEVEISIEECFDDIAQNELDNILDSEASDKKVCNDEVDEDCENAYNKSDEVKENHKVESEYKTDK